MDKKEKFKNNFINSFNRAHSSNKEARKPGRRFNAILLLTCLILIIITTGSILFFVRQVRSLSQESQGTSAYQYHFAFIGDRSSSFQNAEYEAALKEAQANGHYVEFTGKNLDSSFTESQLINIAVQSKVDGIIVHADDSEELRLAIDDAVSAGIPVICVGTDSYGSKRQSFVGISYYTLGEYYGELISSLSKEKIQKVCVIASPEEQTTGQNLVIAGIRSSFEKHNVLSHFNISSQVLGENADFSTEEAVTSLFESEKLPDILVCLDETTTSSVCQAVVDTNHVGDVTIYGYYINETILNAVRKEVAAATLSVSTDEIGKTAVDNLQEYLNSGFVSEYSSIDVETVTEQNADAYTTGEEDTDS